MAAPQKHRACNRLGRPFCDKACNRLGGPPCDKPTKDYSTLHRGPRQGFVTEAGGTASNPTFESQPYIYICIYTCTYTYIYIYMCVCMYMNAIHIRLLIHLYVQYIIHAYIDIYLH